VHALTGILVALTHRDRTGQGQRVDTSLLSVLLSSMVNQASGYLGAGSVPAIMGNRHPSIAPYQTFATADRPIALAVGNDKQFRLLVGALELDDLADDERFTSNALRVRHRDKLCALLAAEFAKHGADHWYDILTSVGVPAGPINDMAEAFIFGEKLGLTATVAVPGSSTPQVTNPITLSATPPKYRSAPPRLGENTPDESPTVPRRRPDLRRLTRGH
jgi:crotonobetainyl-CoA:carnitine CoA-transferase CaiB-like acyl-CoA transferase